MTCHFRLEQSSIGISLRRHWIFCWRTINESLFTSLYTLSYETTYIFIYRNSFWNYYVQI
jgi:hypothetical protein